MRSLFLSMIFLFGIAATFATSTAATIKREDSARASVSIEGQIVQGDAARLRREISSAIRMASTKAPLVIYLSSEGGSVSEAIAMGRMLRKEQATAIVIGKCLSACVFLMAGAVSRTSVGERPVGIHRPHLSIDEATTPQKQRAQQERFGSEIREYLREMNISPVLYEKMIRVSPNEIRLLTLSEQQELGLIGQDPYWEDARIAKKAKQSGVSTLTVRSAEDFYKSCYLRSPSEEQAEKCASATQSRFGVNIKE